MKHTRARLMYSLFISLLLLIDFSGHLPPVTAFKLFVEQVGWGYHPDQRSRQRAVCRRESHGQEREEARLWQPRFSKRHQCRRSKARFRSSAPLPPAEGRGVLWLPP